jgi:hypothetical protein
VHTLLVSQYNLNLLYSLEIPVHPLQYHLVYKLIEELHLWIRLHQQRIYYLQLNVIFLVRLVLTVQVIGVNVFLVIQIQ